MTEPRYVYLNQNIYDAIAQEIVEGRLKKPIPLNPPKPRTFCAFCGAGEREASECEDVRCNLQTLPEE